MRLETLECTGFRKGKNYGTIRLFRYTLQYSYEHKSLHRSQINKIT